MSDGKSSGFTYPFPRPSVTVDVALVTVEPRPLVLLIQRRHEPFAGSWALPGGFVDENEPLIDAARTRAEGRNRYRALGSGAASHVWRPRSRSAWLDGQRSLPGSGRSAKRAGDGSRRRRGSQLVRARRTASARLRSRGNHRARPPPIGRSRWMKIFGSSVSLLDLGGIDS